MVNALYWVSSIVYALVLFLILLHDIRINRTPEKVEKAFRILLVWVMFFCLQDAFWGFCGGSIVSNDRAFFLASTVFHLSTVMTTFFWLKYILEYLSESIHYKKVWLFLDGIVICMQITMLVINCFRPVIFWIADGQYITAHLRPLAFFNQYIVYLLIGVISAVKYFTANHEEKNRFLTVAAFSIAPILSGIFQLLYPDGPFYSMGYFLSCFCIHIFVVSNDREKLYQFRFQRQIEEQIYLANTDKLTGLPNRRAYEEDLKSYGELKEETHFVYLSADVNGLKVVNDTLGHAAGDELLRGAAQVLRSCLQAYGQVYRIGGDEFAAILFADREQVSFLQADIERSAYRWHGSLIEELSISLGFAGQWEFPGQSAGKLAKEADGRMYRSKEQYYKDRGIDRRGQHMAYAALCSSYAKILRVNLTEDTYQIVQMDQSEMTLEKGFSESISQWLRGFGLSGQVHPEDLEEYLAQVDISYLKAAFASGKKAVHIFYRRKIGDSYRQAKMEILPAEEYSDAKQVLYLYVKDIDR